MLHKLSQVLPGQNLYDTGPGNTPNDTHVTVVVAVDDQYLATHGISDTDALETMITTSIMSSMNISFHLTLEDYKYINFSTTDIEALINDTNNYFFEIGRKHNKRLIN